MNEDHQLNILIVDPEPLVGEVINSIAEADGHISVSTKSSVEALKKLDQAFDIIFLHRGQVGINIEEIIKCARTRSLPMIVLLSSQMPDQAEVDKIRIGADEIIYKPINFDKVTSIFERRINNKKLTYQPTDEPKILLIQQDQLIFTELKKIINNLEFVNTAIGINALKKIREKNYDILIAPLAISDMTFRDFINHAKTINPNFSFIVLTGSNNSTDSIEALRNGASDLIYMPLQSEFVVKTIESVWYTQKLKIENRALLINLQKTAHLLQKSNRELLLANNDSELLHKQALENLERLKTFKQILDHSGDAIYIIDSKTGRFIEVNATALKMLGYTRQEILQMSLHDIEMVDENSSAEIHFSNFFSKIQLNNNHYITESIHRNKNGSTLPVELSATIQNLNSKKYVLVMARNIIERHEKDKQLLKLSYVVEQNPVFVLITDRDGKIEYVNPSFLNKTGYSLNEVIGKFANILNSGVQTKEFYNKLWQTILSGNIWHGAFKNKKKNGEFYWARAVISPLKDSKGNLINFIALQEDITDQVIASETEKKQKEQLFEASRLATLGTLIAGIGHEINNPNNFIMMNAPTLLKMWLAFEPILKNIALESPNSKVKGIQLDMILEKFPILIADIADGSKRIKEIVLELKNFAKKDDYDYHQKVDINETVRSACKLTQNIINKSTDNFCCIFDDNAPLIDGNAQRLEQVLIVIIENACQALLNRESKILITTSLNTHDQTVMIIVKDEGAGISKENLLKIKDPFFTTKRSTGGMGLGLSICYSIIEKHGGEMKIESELNEGTSVIITLKATK